MSKLTASEERRRKRRTKANEEVIDGRFRIEANLGYGGYGKVFRVVDLLNQETLALKIFKNTADDGYFNELGHLYGLPTDYLVVPKSFGYTSKLRYLVFEYLGGGSLRDFLTQCSSYSLTTAIEILLSTARGLADAQASQLIHCDLKPENILFNDTRWPSALKICDFGHSRRQFAEAPGQKIGLRGSPGYMAPEQFGSDYDHRVDHYALGVIFYELLLGQRPFTGSLEEIRLIQLRKRPSLPGALPKDLKELLVSLLARNPDHRPATAAIIVSRLEVLLQRYGRALESTPEITSSRLHFS